MAEVAATNPASRARSLRVVVAWFLVTRLIVLAVAQVGGANAIDRFKDAWAPGNKFLSTGTPPHPLLEPTVRWDAILYIGLAREGYTPPREGPVWDIAFFPAYPYAVSLLENVVGDTFIAAFILSHVEALLAALLILLLGRRHFSEELGLRAAMLFLCAPGAGFLSYPYTEAQFAMFTTLALLLSLENRPLSAGLAGALASATRSTGLVVTLVLLWSAWEHRRDVRVAFERLVGAALSTGGIVAYSLFCWQRHGDPLAWMHIQKWWNRHTSVLGPFKAFLAFDHDPDYYLVSITAIVVAVMALRRMPIWVSLANAFLILLPISTGTLASMIRFQSNNVPLLLSAAKLLEGKRFRIAVVACTALMMFETYLYAVGYAHN
ncbi:MAG: mannosyltransferase family protein [Myxococcota bacterium]